jgi:hypothetical protein
VFDGGRIRIVTTAMIEKCKTNVIDIEVFLEGEKNLHQKHRIRTTGIRDKNILPGEG